MTKRKLTTVLGLFIVLLFSALISVIVSVTPKVYAESRAYFSAERYTDSDKLLTTNGIINENKDIVIFSKEVQLAANNVSFPELAQVIPLQYLESSEENAVFAYNGKEYGFYVAKEGERFDVLLIDFVFEFDDRDHSDLEYIIKIKPILQQSFMRSSASNGYEWKKYGGKTYRYYVSNPRFLVTLQNENTLNYGDNGYSKFNDDGLIIVQSRINYGNVGYSTESDLEFGIFKLVGNIVLDAATAGTGGTVLGIIKDGSDIYNSRLEETIITNNEYNINTNFSKQAQRDNEKLNGYSRVAGFAPQKEIVLSDEKNSYAEFITVLNDGNYKSRLNQICEFDIVRRNKDFGSMEYVAGEVDKPFDFSKERVFFEHQQPKFEINNNFSDAAVSVYLLPHGEQEVSFTPKYSGVYNFALPDNAVMSLDGIQKQSFSLEANNMYTFKISGALDVKIIGIMQFIVENYLDDNKLIVPANTNSFICYSPTENGCKKILNNAGLCIGIIDEKMNELAAPDNNIIYYNFIVGRKYYFLISNKTNNAIQTSLQINNLNDMSIGISYQITSQNKAMSFTNRYSTAVNYKLTLANDDGVNAVVINNLGVIVSNESESVGNSTEYNFSLAAKATYSIFFSGDIFDIPATATLTVNPTQCKWKIVDHGSQETVTQSKKLKPNSTYNIEMDMYVNGIKIDTFNSFILYSFGLDCKHTEGQLEIGNLKNNEKILLVPREAPEFGLTVTIDNMKRKVKLDYDNGTVKDVEFELGQVISNISMPTKVGYQFDGFYTQRDGKGIQYVDKKMVGKVWDIDSNDIILYASWQANEYKVIIHNINEYLPDQTITIVVKYGSEMPELSWFAPAKSGNEFVGFFSEPNGKGTQYYYMDFANSPQEAAQLGCDEYWREKPFPCNGVRWFFPEDGNLYSYFKPLEMDFAYGRLELETYKALGASQPIHFVNGIDVLITAEEIQGYDFQYFTIGSRKVTEKTMEFRVELNRSGGSKIVSSVYNFIAWYSESSCITSGALITLADGRQVPVESLKGDEMLLVWNLQTGTFDASRILFIDKDPAQVYKVINLGFSDGTTVKVVSEHAFWDYDLNEYVYLNDDAAKYIGHWFSKQETDLDGKMRNGRAQLISVDIRDEYTTTYSPVTYGHLCYYVNGMLSVPGGISGLFNIFDVDPETMAYDQQSMQRDIERYGLFTYSEFAELVPVSEEVFHAFNGQYLKIAIGKGLTTIDELQRFAMRYAEFFE